MPKKPKAIDLFAGCGGVSEGLRQAGFEVVGAVEIEPVAAKTYQLNHPKVSLMVEDIRNIDGRKWLRKMRLKRGELDLLVGCPPCQGFSTLRTRNGATWTRDPRNNLVSEMGRLIEEIRPKAVMMENVPGLAEKKIFAQFAKQLSDLGYAPKYEIIDVQDYGVPQRRKRLVLIASRTGEIPFPRTARKTKTVRDALAGLPRAGHSGDEIHDLPENRTKAVLRKIARIPKNGGSRTDLPRTMQLDCHRRCDGFKDIYGRMSWDDVAPTITSGCFNPSKGRFLHPEEDRAITMREAALLQTFPRNYKFDVSCGKVGVALMIGNALPPELVRRQAAVVKRALRATSK